MYAFHMSEIKFCLKQNLNNTHDMDILGLHIYQNFIIIFRIASTGIKLGNKHNTVILTACIERVNSWFTVVPF